MLKRFGTWWFGSNSDGPEQLDDRVKLDQFKLIYDYVKFHITLYIATPAVFKVVADTFEVTGNACFRDSLVTMIAIYAVSAIHASWFMGRPLNEPWQSDYVGRLGAAAFSKGRRVLHHTFYWIGLVVGLVGLWAPSWLAKYCW